MKIERMMACSNVHGGDCESRQLPTSVQKLALSMFAFGGHVRAFNFSLCVPGEEFPAQFRPPSGPGLQLYRVVLRIIDALPEERTEVEVLDLLRAHPCLRVVHRIMADRTVRGIGERSSATRLLASLIV